MPELFSEKQSARKWWTAWTVLVICILVTGICLGVYYVYPDILCFTEEKGGDEPCLTENCLKAAIKIMSSIDTTQEPCMDFYQFTCGNFMAEAYKNNNPSPYFVQSKRNINKLNAIIAEPINGDEGKPLLLQKTFYQTCMNVTAIDEDENETFKQLIKELGGWPILKGQKWKEDRIDLKKLIIQCKNLGLPFQWFFQVLYKDSWDQIWIDRPIITKGFNESFKESVYLNLMVNTAAALGASSKILATSEMEKIIHFEKELEEIVIKNNESAATNFDINQLHNVFPRFSLFHFVNNLTEDVNYTLTENDTIASSEAYLQDLTLLLARTSKRVQINYIVWKIIQEFGPYLSTPFRENFLNFTNFMISKKGQTNTRFEFCIKEAKIRFPRVAEIEFINLYSNEEKTRNIMEMIRNIEEQFVLRLEAASWIDEETKKVAVNKVRNIVEIIGHHKLDFDVDILEKFLNTVDLEFTSENIITMIREKNINDFNQKFLLKDIPSVDSLTAKIVNNALDINAGYAEITNMIVMSAGIIQDTLYSENRPNYLNYGALGSIIGHEITHGFNKEAYTHDSEEEEGIIATWFNESLNEINNIAFINTTYLWQNDTLEALVERMKCVVDDHELFDVEANGEESATENVADLIGINTAYEAYMKWAEENGEEAMLPGLPYTPAQLYWIQFGIINCYKEIPSTDWRVIEGAHASLKYRVINPLRNSENFAKDFECPSGTPMNPVDKCHVF